MAAAPPSANQELWAGLQGRLPRPPVPPAYVLGLLVVSLAMIVLPLIYLALVAASAWAVVWWAINGLGLLTEGSLSSVKIRLFIYVVPLFAGGAVPFFLLKPFFSRSTATADDLVLDRRQQPQLFAFVEHLASVVGAPVPDRITVDTQVNAGAGLELGLLRREGSKLVLNIGLPLAAGLTLPQLTGVLAHEFGHFGQGLAMRLSQIIWRVNGWFQRVVYERDRWDESLDRGVAEGGWTGIAYAVARFMVALGRKVLFGLMVVGHGVSCFLTRQMEFDADQYEARVSGSAVFADTQFRLRVLDAASSHVLNGVLGDGRFVDDVPALVARVADNAPPRLMTAIRMDVQRSGTGLFDSHPSDLARLQRARAGRFPGLLSGSAPAAALFHAFPDVCRQATIALYERALGRHAPGQHALLPVSAFIAPAEEPASAAEGKAKAARLEFPPERAPRLAEKIAPAPGDAASLSAARARWRSLIPAAATALEKFSRAETQALDAGQAEALMAAGLHVRPQQFSLPEATPAGIERTCARARALQDESAADIEAAEGALAARIGLAVGALEAGVAPLPEAAELHKSAQRLMVALPGFESIQRAAAPLRSAAVVLECLLANQKNRMGHGPLDEEIHRRLPDVREALDAIRAALEKIQLPGPEWDIPPPWRDDPASFARSAQRALAVLDTQHAQAVGRLVQIAARVEDALIPAGD